MAVIEKDLGPVSAYAVAVAHGYTGTEAEWEALISNSAINAQSAGASATAAAASALEAAQQKTQAQAQAAAALAHEQNASRSAQTAGQANSYAQMAKNNAAVSAANASNAQTAAEAAQAAAEAAVTGAEAAQAAAEAAVTDAQTAKTAAETAAATAAAAYGTDLLADDYSTSKTYAVGDYVIYSGNLYRCTTAITTAEAWTAAHWTQAQIGPDVSDLKSATHDSAKGLDTVFPSWEKGTIDKYGAESADNNRYRTIGYLDAEVGVNYTFTGKNNNIPLVRWYDANNVYKSSTTNFIPDASGNCSLTIAAPQPKYRVVINTSSPSKYPTAVDNVGIAYESELYERVTALETADQEIDDRIDGIENGLLDNRIPLTLEWEQGNINTSGEEESASNYYRTDFIDTHVGDTYNLTATMSNGFILRWYDSGKRFIETKDSKSAVSGETQTNEIIAAHPYVRIVNNSADNASYPATPGNVVMYKKLNGGLTKANYYVDMFGEKKVDCLGDSFTYVENDGWWKMIANKTGWTMQGYGVISSRISKDFTKDGVTAESFLNRYDGMDTSADAVVIFGGINDCVFLNNGTITMGDMTSTLDENTFYGALRLLIESIHDPEFMPDCKILGVIPPDFEQDAAHLTWLPQVQEAEREIYSYYGIPYVDLKKDCQEMYESEYNLGKYRLVTQSTQNYHPSTDGFRAIASIILGGLEKIFNGNSF